MKLQKLLRKYLVVGVFVFPPYYRTYQQPVPYQIYKVPLIGPPNKLRLQYIEDDILPTKYDAREHDQVTPIKDQGRYGTCQAYAGMSALEASFMPPISSCIKEKCATNYDIRLSIYYINKLKRTPLLYNALGVSHE